MPTFIRRARSPHPNLSTPEQSTMGSKIDQAWEDMKGPEAAKSRAYASRVKWILNGSKPAHTRSARGVPTGVQPRQRPSSNLALYGLEPNALDSQESSVSHFRATCPREPIGAEGPRIVPTGTIYQVADSANLLAACGCTCEQQQMSVKQQMMTRFGCSLHDYRHAGHPDLATSTESFGREFEPPRQRAFSSLNSAV